MGSFLLYAGWGLRTCNMPSVHSITTGSVLNKQVSCADKTWGKPWSKISSAMKVYAIADINHGWVTYVTIVGCLLRDLFPDPDSILFLMGTEQGQFVGELNTLLLE